MDWIRPDKARLDGQVLHYFPPVVGFRFSFASGSLTSVLDSTVHYILHRFGSYSAVACPGPYRRWSPTSYTTWTLLRATSKVLGKNLVKLVGSLTYGNRGAEYFSKQKKKGRGIFEKKRRRGYVFGRLRDSEVEGHWAGGGEERRSRQGANNAVVYSRV